MLGRIIGLIWYYGIPVRVSVAKDNARRVFGAQKTEREIAQIIREACVYQATNALECLTVLNSMHEPERPCFRMHGLESYRKALQGKRGVCVVSLHLGNFEQSIALIAAKGFKLNIIYRPISWKPLHDYWNMVRETLGIRALSHRQSRDAIRAALKRGESVGFACDQHMPPHRGIVSTFLGQPAATTPAPARFALESDAPIIIAHTYRDPESPWLHHLHFEEFSIERGDRSQNDIIEHNTHRINDILSDLVLKHPEQWLWHHRRFKVSERLSDYERPNDNAESAASSRRI